MLKLLLAAVCLAAAAFTAGGDAHAAGAVDVCFQTALSNTSPGVPSGIRTTVSVGLGPDCTRGTGDDPAGAYQLGAIVQNTQPQWFVARDSDIPDGTHVGELSVDGTYGILNNPCAISTPDTFLSADLFDATTDTTGKIDPLPSGEANRLKPLSEDYDSDGVPNIVDRWPSFLSTMATQNGWDLSQLRARIAGTANMVHAGNFTFAFNLLVFEPGSPVHPNVAPPDPSLGYSTLLILNDPTSPGSWRDFINDFCSPSSIEWELFGTADGIPVRENPLVDGPYDFWLYAIVHPDADGDGFENRLDTCPLEPNEGDARANPDIGDNDHDGIDSVCQPGGYWGYQSCGGLANTDKDLDCWMNRSDNCPLEENDDQADADGDDIGDACDERPGEPDGARFGDCLMNRLTISGTAGQATASVHTAGNNCIDAGPPWGGATPSPSPTPAQPVKPPSTGGPSSPGTTAWLLAAIGAVVAAACACQPRSRAGIPPAP